MRPMLIGSVLLPFPPGRRCKSTTLKKPAMRGNSRSQKRWTRPLSGKSKKTLALNSSPPSFTGCMSETSRPCFASLLTIRALQGASAASRGVLQVGVLQVDRDERESERPNPLCSRESGFFVIGSARGPTLAYGCPVPRIVVGLWQPTCEGLILAFSKAAGGRVVAMDDPSFDLHSSWSYGRLRP
jgi:hypothetical protein